MKDFKHHSDTHDFVSHEKVAIEASRCNRLLCLRLPERAASDFFLDPLS